MIKILNIMLYPVYWMLGHILEWLFGPSEGD